jgi:hypothetical protein
MKKKDPQNTKVRPHDAFFKESFSMLAIAKEYVLHFLPQAIVSKLDLDQMVLDNTTYITPELEQYYADLVWTCKYGKSKVRIAFLFEHKSKPEKYPHLQLLRYLLEIWDRDVKSKKPLTPVIPIVIYHGKPKWKIREFKDYFKGIGPELWEYLPSFRYELTDLSGYSPEDIQHTKAGLLINALLALQYGNNVNFIRKHFSIFFHDENGSLNEDSNRNFIQLIIVYLFKNNEFSTVESKQLLATISEPIKKKVMNTYDRIIAEGFKLKEYEVVKKAYNKKYPAAEIAELLDISIEKVKSIIEAIKKEGEN